jgi:hypothetical protein
MATHGTRFRPLKPLSRQGSLNERIAARQRLYRYRALAQRDKLRAHASRSDFMPSTEHALFTLRPEQPGGA